MSPFNKVSKYMREKRKTYSMFFQQTFDVFPNRSINPFCSLYLDTIYPCNQSAYISLSYFCCLYIHIIVFFFNKVSCTSSVASMMLTAYYLLKTCSPAQPSSSFARAVKNTLCVCVYHIHSYVEERRFFWGIIHIPLHSGCLFFLLGYIVYTSRARTFVLQHTTRGAPPPMRINNILPRVSRRSQSGGKNTPFAMRAHTHTQLYLLHASMSLFKQPRDPL